MKCGLGVGARVVGDGDLERVGHLGARVFPTPLLQGIPVVLLANIAPHGAVGTIQFMDGTFALGAQ